jgi:hypothetical protein
MMRMEEFQTDLEKTSLHCILGDCTRRAIILNKVGPTPCSHAMQNRGGAEKVVMRLSIDKKVVVSRNSAELATATDSEPLCRCSPRRSLPTALHKFRDLVWELVGIGLPARPSVSRSCHEATPSEYTLMAMPPNRVALSQWAGIRGRCFPARFRHAS